MARQVGAALAIAAPALAALLALLQAMRLLPLVAGAGPSAGEALELAGLLALLLASTSLPAATVLSVVGALGRLEADGEVLGLRAAGAGPARIAAGPAALCLVVAALSGGAALFAEPHAYGVLRERVGALLLRAAASRVRAGVLAEPVPGLVVLARSRRGELLEGLFIEDRRGAEAVHLFAERGRLSLAREGGSARLRLDRGAVHVGGGAARLSRARFEALDSLLDLGGASRELGGVLPAHLALTPAELAAASGGPGVEGTQATLLLHRRLAAGPATVGLSLLALGLALRRASGPRLWALPLAAGAILGFHLLGRLGEAAAGAGRLAPALGAWLPALACWAALAGWVALSRLHVLWWTRALKDRPREERCDTPPR